MQALVRIQAYMLADNVVAIAAVERQWCEGGSESVGVCCPALAPTYTYHGTYHGTRVRTMVHMCVLEYELATSRRLAS